MNDAAPEPWYRDGLRFSCTRCGHCCTGEPGFTWLSDQETEVLAARLGMQVEAFCRRYTRLVHRAGQQRRALLDTNDHACIFFAKGQGCTVYSDRPRQCRTWPFWRANLATAEDWAAAAQGCPGMNRGTLTDAATIRTVAADDGLP